MTGILWDVCISLFNTVTIYFIADYFYSIFSVRVKKFNVTVALSLLVFFISPLLLGKGLINLVLLALSLYVISLSFDLSFSNRLLFTLIFVSLNALSEVLCGTFITAILGTNVTEATEGNLFLFGSVISKILCLLLCILISTFKSKTLIGRFRKSWSAVYALPFATILVGYVLYHSSVYYQNNIYLTELSLFSLILLVISNILIISTINSLHESVENKNRLIIAEELIGQQKTQYDLMFSNNEQILKLRHDHKNFIVGLLSQADDNRSVKAYLENELMLLNSFSNMPICGDSVIDTVINYKITEAKDKNVSISVKYRNLHGIDVVGTDLSILLGNALDNAIEAASIFEDTSQRKVDISLCCRGNQLIISVSNPVKQDKDVNTLCSEKGKGHGYGIVNMRRIAEKYNGSVTLSCENKSFCTIIMLEKSSNGSK